MKIGIIGSGMGSLSAGALLAKDGHAVHIIEQNYLPGGCTSSYYRKGFIFEAGATTVVGLDEHMPLRYILEQTAIQIDMKPLDRPMQIRLKNGQQLERFANLEDWIREAERIFGPKGQAAFWRRAYAISQFVWETSLQQQSFPPSSWRDLGPMIKGFRPKQLAFAGLAFRSMKKMLQQYGLDKNPDFIAFVNEQLLITAQNYLEEVNVLFGATALCYTLFGNYYVYGGLYQLVKPFCDYIEAQGGQLHLRRKVEQIERKNGQYILQTNQGPMAFDRLISGIPINNLLDIWPNKRLHQRYKKRLLQSPQLNSAFQMGIGFKRREDSPVLHHQIHLKQPLSQIGSQSIFLSFSDPIDWYRAPLGQGVASISTHIPDPARRPVKDKAALEEEILKVLDEEGYIAQNQVLYRHSSASSSWESWTQRKFGFVGGYPQFLRIKPWQMLDARLEKGAYLCGDTAYPGQGIPGVALSGIIAYKKLLLDG